MNKTPGLHEIIDVHSHIYPDPYLRHLESREQIPRIVRHGEERLFTIFPEEVNNGGAGGRPMGNEFWDLDEKLAYMDRNGIECTVISLGNPWLNPMPTAEGEVLASDVNKELGTYRSLTGGRLVGMGALPASSVARVIVELGSIAQNEGLVGASAGPKIAGLPLDHHQLEPFWSELERLDLPLFVHPENGIAVNELQGYGHALPIGVAFPMETTVAITRLVFGGVLERHPNLRIMVAHGGGTLPFLSGRLDVVWRTAPKVQANLPHTPSEYLQRLYYDGLVYYGPALQALTRLVGHERVMFGTDHPFNVADPQANIDAIRGEFNNTPATLHLLSKNAKKFFGL